MAETLAQRRAKYEKARKARAAAAEANRKKVQAARVAKRKKPEEPESPYRRKLRLRKEAYEKAMAERASSRRRRPSSSTPASPAKPKAAAKPAAKSTAKPAARKSKFGVGSSKTVMHNGRKMANVTAEQLKKTGLSLRQYMNKWNKTGSRPR